VIRIFKSKVIRDLLSETELESLVADFRLYKSTGVVPSYFGRDVPYDHPSTLPLVKSEEVQHIHFGSEEQPFPLNKIQFYRTSDVHLVYCKGASNSDTYLLMTILAPDAHDQAKSRNIMYKLANMAEQFRNKY